MLPLSRKSTDFLGGQNPKSMKCSFDQFRVDTFSSPMKSQQQIDALVGREMKQLSKIQIENILHDIHGIIDIPDEYTLNVDAKFAELEAEIQRITLKAAYKQALSISEEYVRDRSFLLKFLRADSFNAANAARRLVSFFEQKNKIFGEDKLVKDITLSDLSAEDLEVLENGHMAFLPKRDMSGRVVFCNIRSRERFTTTNNLLRAIYYMLMAEVEDEDVQRKGIVGILYSFSLMAEKIDSHTIVRSAELRNAIPIRFVSMHYCFNHPTFLDYINCERYAFSKHTRLRCRAHKVSATDFHSALVLSELVSFGITPHSIPPSLIGGLKTKSHEEWIQMRHKKDLESCVGKPVVLSELPRLPTSAAVTGETQKSLAVVECIDEPIMTVQSAPEARMMPNFIENVDSSDSGDFSSSSHRLLVLTPSSVDVLFGRGRVKEHPGNMRLHQLVGKRSSRYEVAEKWEKTVIAEEIVVIIKESSGRFLRPIFSGQGWLEVDKEVAREKVSHTFRSRRPKIISKRRRKGERQQPRIFVNKL